MSKVKQVIVTNETEYGEFAANLLDDLLEDEGTYGLDYDALKVVYSFYRRDMYGRVTHHYSVDLEGGSGPSPAEHARKALEHALTQEPLPFGARIQMVACATTAWEASEGWEGRPSEDPNRVDIKVAWLLDKGGVSAVVKHTRTGDRHRHVNENLPPQVSMGLGKALL